MIENQSCNILVKDKTWQNQKSANLMKGDIWGNMKLEKTCWLRRKKNTCKVEKKHLQG